MQAMEGILGRVERLPFVKAREKEQANPEHERLMGELQETKQRLENARQRFDLETNFDLIEACILEVEALERRYSYLLKEAKRERVRAF